MLVIGITGGTGCGKTTALDRVKARGGCVLDCDAVYHDLLESCAPMLAEIEQAFPGVVEGGALQRKKLGERVFQNPEALQALSNLTASYIIEAVERELDAARENGCALAAIDAIGLCESKLKDLCQTTVAVLAPTEARVARLMTREGVSEEYARLRIAAQKSNETFTDMCDHVLMNDCASAAEFGAVCDQFLNSLLDHTKEHEHERRK